MDRDTSYPDPAQLRRYAQNPMPFHEITAVDLRILEHHDEFEDGTIRVTKDNVEYTYRPGDIRVEVSPDEWEHVDDVDDVEMDHFDAWEETTDWQIEEDFIGTMGVFADHDGEVTQCEAFWVLDAVTISET